MGADTRQDRPETCWRIDIVLVRTAAQPHAWLQCMARSSQRGSSLSPERPLARAPGRVEKAWRASRTSAMAARHDRRSIAIAVASPPPMQSEATPRLSPYWVNAASSVTTIRAPEAPIGWPSAQAPPWMFTLS